MKSLADEIVEREIRLSKQVAELKAKNEQLKTALCMSTMTDEEKKQVDTVRSTNSSKQMFVLALNTIREEARSIGAYKIETTAERALIAAGVMEAGG